MTAYFDYSNATYFLSGYYWSLRAIVYPGGSGYPTYEDSGSQNPSKVRVLMPDTSSILYVDCLACAPQLKHIFLQGLYSQCLPRRTPKAVLQGSVLHIYIYIYNMYTYIHTSYTCTFVEYIISISPGPKSHRGSLRGHPKLSKGKGDSRISYTYTYTCAYVYTHIYTYIHIYISTYMHMV